MRIRGGMDEVREVVAHLRGNGKVQLCAPEIELVTPAVGAGDRIVVCKVCLEKVLSSQRGSITVSAQIVLDKEK